MLTDRSQLTTEQQNANSEQIDRMTTEQIVSVINAEDARIAGAVAKEQTKIASAIDMIVDHLRQKGHLFYVGAGTSGRLGVLDASECPPTFGVKPSLVQGIIAGGRRALVRSIEGAEDRPLDGVAEIKKSKVSAADVVVGIAACGLTQFVHGALSYAQELKAGTIFVTCAPEAVQHIPAEIIINPVVGPEVITGSTRMKAGTATKLVLNTLTTATMIKLGKVYGNLMVDLNATNDKLKDRSLRILIKLTGLDRDAAEALLTRADGRLKSAIVMHYRKTDLKTAQKILKQSQGSLRNAIEDVQ